MTLKIFARILANLFVVFHLLTLFVWTLPNGALRNHLAPHIEKYMLASALWQNWEMFSPSPQTINFHLDAEVTLRDGDRRTWIFPRMEHLGYFERYQKERYRKWRERIRQDSYASVWPDTARFIIRSFNDDPANPPVRISLARHWADIPPPKAAHHQPIPSSYLHGNHYTFFNYEVLPGDLP